MSALSTVLSHLHLHVCENVYAFPVDQGFFVTHSLVRLSPPRCQLKPNWRWDSGIQVSCNSSQASTGLLLIWRVGVDSNRTQDKSDINDPWSSLGETQR